MTQERDEPPRAVAHFGLLILVGFMVVASLLVSTRAPTLASFNNVAIAGPVPAGVKLTDYGDDWSVLIHRSDWRAPVAALLGHTTRGRPPRLGWVVREWSFLGLPLFATRQGDLAAVKEDEYGYRLVGLTNEEQAAVAAKGGPGLYPFWRYSWGLLAIAAVAAWVWLEFRWQARRRAALGLI